jgi:hypothetical protein
MSRCILISINEHEIKAELENTATADAIYAALPFESQSQTWGDEVYFSVPVTDQTLEDNAKDVVKLGEIAYWVEGDCIAIGFGPTPISRGNEIRLAARTNIWAHTNYDLTMLKNVRSGDLVKVKSI